MKKRKKSAGFVLVLCISMLLGGCGVEQKDTHTVIYENGEKHIVEEDTSEIPMGRYLEKEITLPEKFHADSMQLLADETLVLLDATENGQIAYSMDYGITWTVEENYTWKELQVRGCRVLTMAVSPEREIFLSYLDESSTKKSGRAGVACTNTDGNSFYPQISFEKIGECVTDAVYTSDGTLFVLTDAYRVYEVDLQEEMAQYRMELPVGEKSHIYAYENSIAASDEESIFFYQRSTNSIVVPDVVLNSFYRQSNNFVLCGGKGKVYVTGRDGIYSHSHGGNLMEQIADGELNRLGQSAEMPETIVVTEDGTLFILYKNGRLYSYVYDESVPAWQPQEK